jgi:hypothetical protein
MFSQNRLVIYSAAFRRYYERMRTHQEIDSRSLVMAREIVKRIDADPKHSGVVHAREVCRRWNIERQSPVISEWLEILEKPWAEIRSILLDEGEYGKRLRQSSPFAGILSNRERWRIYRKHKTHDQK